MLIRGLQQQISSNENADLRLYCDFLVPLGRILSLSAQIEPPAPETAGAARISRVWEGPSGLANNGMKLSAGAEFRATDLGSRHTVAKADEAHSAQRCARQPWLQYFEAEHLPSCIEWDELLRCAAMSVGAFPFYQWEAPGLVRSLLHPRAESGELRTSKKRPGRNAGFLVFGKRVFRKIQGRRIEPLVD